MTTTMQEETFVDFKNSFSYGSRTDLNFKFLKGLSPDQAADFIQELFWAVGEAIDSGQVEPLMEKLIAGQTRNYAGPSAWTYEEAPFTPLAAPPAATRLGLLTSSGHFLEGADPEPFGIQNMTQEEAVARIGDFLKIAPTLTEIPVDTPLDRLRVRHGGYDIRGALADPQVAFPLAHLRQLAADGVIGRLADPAYSFVGACAQMQLLRQTGPAWLGLLRERRVEAALLVPV